jgi:hypothetical protein
MIDDEINDEIINPDLLFIFMNLRYSGGPPPPEDRRSPGGYNNFYSSVTKGLEVGELEDPADRRGEEISLEAAS